MAQQFTEFLITGLLAAGVSLVVYAIYPRFRKFGGARPIRFVLSRSDRVVGLLFAGYVFTFSALAVLKHLSFQTFGFDLGFWDQTVWNSLNGRVLQLSLLYDVRILLEQHFSPIVLAFVPLYAVWDDPIVLLIVQSLALGIAVLPIYWYARERLGLASALVIALAFLLFPALEFSNLNEFHEMAMSTPILAFAMFFLLRGENKAFLVCVAPLLLVKEQMGLIAFFIGVYISIVRKDWRFGLPLALSGIVFVVLLLQLFFPYLRGGAGYYFFGNGVSGGYGKFDYLGANLSEIVETLATRPDIWLPKVLIPEKLVYVLHFLVPLGFLPLIGGEVAALVLPTLGLALISTFPYQYSIESHYALSMIPFFFFATVIGMERILGWAKRSSRVDRSALQSALVALVLVASVASYFLQSPGPLTQHFGGYQYQAAFDARTQVAYSMMQEIPPDVVLVAQKGLVPHMTHRQHIWEFPYAPDYRQADYLFIDKLWVGYSFDAMWKTWLDTSYFSTVEEREGFVIAKRRTPEHSLDIRYGDAASLLGYTIITTDTLHGRETLRPMVEWSADRNIGKRYVMQVHLVDSHGHLWAKDESEPDGGTRPTNNWIANERVGDQYTLKLPPTMPPDDYYLTISVCAASDTQCLPARDSAGQLLGDEPRVATVHVEKDKTSITASQIPIEAELLVDMGEVRFLGYIPPRQTITTGEPFSLGLYWRARSKPRGDYVPSIQLRDTNNEVAFEDATRPAHGMYPTTLWDSGEALLDWHDFVIPSSLPAGTYTIYVVLRDSATNSVLGEARIAPLQVVN